MKKKLKKLLLYAIIHIIWIAIFLYGFCNITVYNG